MTGAAFVILLIIFAFFYGREIGQEDVRSERAIENERRREEEERARKESEAQELERKAQELRDDPKYQEALARNFARRQEYLNNAHLTGWPRDELLDDRPPLDDRRQLLDDDNPDSTTER